ncbi:MAG: VanZ family protein [Candidatus Aminicenantales bacterium]
MKIKNLIYFLPSILYYALIFFLSSQSYQIKARLPFSDKGAHFLEFAVFSFLLSFGYFKSLKLLPQLKSVIIIGSGIILAWLDECHQYFVPQRQFDVLDITADSVGIIFGLLLYLYLRQRLKFLKET